MDKKPLKNGTQSIKGGKEPFVDNNHQDDGALETPSETKGRSKSGRKEPLSQDTQPDTASTNTASLDSTSHNPETQTDSVEKAVFEPGTKQHAENIAHTDHLNREKLVSTLARFLTAEENSHHQTIGLLGNWGVGKSSVVALLKKQILKSSAGTPFLFADYNAWEYEHTDNVQAGIAQEMISALSGPEYRLDTEADTVTNASKGLWSYLLWLPERWLIVSRYALKNNGYRILYILATLILSILLPVLAYLNSWFGDLPQTIISIGAPVWVGGFLFYFYRQAKQLFANPMAKELLTYLRLPSYGTHLGKVPVMRENIRKLSDIRLADKKNPKRLLFVVDDLDRCGHEGIVKVFEAVRLVLDIPQVTVIIAVDQRVALAALALNYEKLAKHHSLQNARAIARDYLAKVIHIPIIITPPSHDDIEKYLDKLWPEIKTRNTRELLQNIGSGDGVIDELLPDVESGVDDKTKEQTETPPDEHKQPDDPDFELDTSKLKNLQAPSLIGLSESQRAAFKHWLKHFNLTNPRQVKRLDNCYTLMRNYYGEDEVLSLVGRNAFPLMIALFLIEYVNCIEDRKLAHEYLVKTKTAIQTKPRKTPIDSAKIIDSTVFGVLRESFINTGFSPVELAEPFVLPAVEYDHTVETNEPSLNV